MRSPPLLTSLELGYSFCPNDTFIFYALQAGLIQAPLPIKEVLEDVQTLNTWALEGKLSMTKISYHAYFDLIEEYVALRAGGALGRGVGPLVVARTPLGDLNGKLIASPGALTTADLLLHLAFPEAHVVHMRYDEVMPAVIQGRVDGGLIIHESRFTYLQHDLLKAFDLGAWWEHKTGLPLPLGAILVRRDLPNRVKRELNAAIKKSLAYARAHVQEALTYIRQHALELDDEVIQSHIDLYVNDFSLDVGEEGEKAVYELYRQAVQSGVVRSSDLPLFGDT